MNIIEKFGIDRFSAQNLFEFFKTFFYLLKKLLPTCLGRLVCLRKMISLKDKKNI